MTGRPAVASKQVFDNRGRDYIRRKTVLHALEMGLEALDGG
jgi:nicotinamide-nucleotide amidase